MFVFRAQYFLTQAWDLVLLVARLAADASAELRVDLDRVVHLQSVLAAARGDPGRARAPEPVLRNPGSGVRRLLGEGMAPAGRLDFPLHTNRAHRGFVVFVIGLVPAGCPWPSRYLVLGHKLPGPSSVLDHLAVTGFPARDHGVLHLLLHACCSTPPESDMVRRTKLDRARS